MHSVLGYKYQAIIEYNKVIKIDPYHALAYYRKGIIYLLGNELIRFGYSKKGLSIISKLLRLTRLDDCYFNRCILSPKIIGNLYRNLGKRYKY